MIHSIENRLLIRELDQRFDRAQDALCVWRREKPFGYVGTCEYARGLVLEMLYCFDEMRRHGSHLNLKIKEDLLKLLNDFPPDYDPLSVGHFLLQ